MGVGVPKGSILMPGGWLSCLALMLRTCADVLLLEILVIKNA
jgi:hypothetical protein